MYIRKTASPAPYDSLLEALELGKQMPKKTFRIAAVGSGGKTTLLYTLAREARKRGLSVLLLPTTHMQLPEKDGVLTGRAEDVMEKLKKDGFAVAGVPVVSPKTTHEPSAHALPSETRKIGFPGLETYEKAGVFADLVLVEADGSRRLPLKYPNETEPVIPEDIDLILSVTGLSALGKDPAKFCHRKELAVEALAKVSPLSSLKDWQTITAQDMALLQKSGYLTPLRSRFPSARVIPVWNQADTEKLRQAALSMLEFLGEKDGLITCTLP